MKEPSKIEIIIKEEVDKLVASLDSQISDPAQKADIAQMTIDLASIPIRMARGEDVSLLLDSLKAEALMRGVRNSFKAQAAAQQAWMNIILRIVTIALTA